MTHTARVVSGILVVFGLSTAPVPSTTSLLTAVVAVVAWIALLRPDPRALLTLVLPALGITAVVCLPLFFRDGSRGAFILARASLSTIAAASFAAGLRPTELVSALRTLRIPAPFATVLATMLRQALTLREEGRRLVLARKLRGARGLAVGPDVVARLLARTAARADRVDLAMHLRGHGAHTAPRAPLEKRDVLGLFCAVVIGISPHLAARAVAS